MQVRIAASFLGSGVLALLDEPQEGLAAESRLVVRALVRGLVRTALGPNTFGRSCVLATRRADEALALGCRVAHLVHGNLVALGLPARLHFTSLPSRRLRSRATRALSCAGTPQRVAELFAGNYVLELRLRDGGDAGEARVLVSTLFADATLLEFIESRGHLLFGVPAANVSSIGWVFERLEAGM